MKTIQVKTQLGISATAAEVFDAIVNPDQICRYFTSSSSGRLENNSTIIWKWDDYQATHSIKVRTVAKPNYISFLWDGSGVETLTEMMLESRGIKSTLVRITESGWSLDESGVLKCMGQTEGWTHFLCCLKAYIEHGVDLRKGGVIT